MRLIFKKDGHDISVNIKNGEEEIKFDYIKMIKLLMEKEVFEDSVFEGEFTEEEKQSVAKMLEDISSAVVTDSSDAGDETNEEETGNLQVEFTTDSEPEELPF